MCSLRRRGIKCQAELARPKLNLEVEALPQEPQEQQSSHTPHPPHASPHIHNVIRLENRWHHVRFATLFRIAASLLIAQWLDGDGWTATDHLFLWTICAWTSQNQKRIHN
jgi:hypothetical protein